MHERLNGTDVASLCRGDKAAWDAFVPVAAALVKAVIRRTLGDHHGEAADVLQEVFVRLTRDRFRVLREFDPMRARLSTWLGVVAAAAAVDCLRRHRPADLPLDEVPEEVLGCVDPPSLSTLRLPPGLLTARQALILALLYEKDLTPEDVAALMNIEPQTVRSQRHKALERLRSAWGVEKRKQYRKNGENDHEHTTTF
jgi:DNA-directed RNA polymerase specialized sigma24 family protein